MSGFVLSTTPGILAKWTPTPNPSPQGGGGRGNADAKSPSPLRGGVRGGGPLRKNPKPQPSALAKRFSTKLDRILLTLAAILFAGVSGALAQETPAAPVASPAVAVDPAKGLPEWEKVYAVFSHPRCANCHVADDHPRWSGAHYGPEPRFHAFNVQRGADGSGFGNPGLRCTTCHFESNSNVLHGPPGAENWHLAPPEMVWFQQSSAQICAQIKDPARNGDRTLEEVAVHVRDDKLVGWGWAPGPGREPAPGSAEETYQAIQAWTAAGAPCPNG